MQIKDFKKNNLPDKPGIYIFKKGKDIIYIGKATSLRNRVRSYFGKDLIVSRGPAILDMVMQASKIDWEVSDNVLEALILEANLIKKYQPKYNVKEKDDRSWNYVCLTDEEIPKVIIKRGKELRNRNSQKFSQVLGSPGPYPGQTIQKSLPDSVSCSDTFGPYTNGLQLREALKIIRPIFPYLDADSIKKNNKEFYKQLGLTPEGMQEYKENIKNLKLFFQGKKKKIINTLKKEMIARAKVRDFEKAGEIKKKIFALEHINDVALIGKDFVEQKFSGGQNEASARRRKLLLDEIRIEAYDVAHLSGENMVGVMAVIEEGELAKREYKKFNIKTQNKSNDTGALEEILARRFRHLEWSLPNLVVVDGSIAQINVATRVLNRYQFKIPVVGVVKDERHKAKAIKGDEKIIKKYQKLILLANSEAHRFAIKFYRSKSRKNMLK